MNWTELLLFSITAIYTPGPNNLLCMTQGATFGFRRTLLFISGIVAGFFCIMLVSGTLNVTMVSLVPALKKIMPPLGCAYMVYLAYKIASGSSHAQEREQPQGFMAGMALQLVNVKVLINALAIMGVYVAPYSHSPAVILQVSLVMALLCAGSCALWSAGGSALKGLLARYDRPVRLVMAAALLWCAYSALSTLWH